MSENHYMLQFPPTRTVIRLLKNGQTRNGNNSEEIHSSVDDPIPTEHQEVVDKATQTIRSCMQDIARNIFRVGEELTIVKRLLGHGRFSCWLKREFVSSDRLAEHWMNVYQRLGDKADLFVRVKPTILYYLAMPSTPEKAIWMVEEKIKAGEQLRLHQVQAIIANCKGPQKRQTKRPHKEHAVSDTDVVVTSIQEALVQALKLLGQPRIRECESMLGRQDARALHTIRADITKLLYLLEVHAQRTQSEPSVSATEQKWSQVHEKLAVIDIQPFSKQDKVFKLATYSEKDSIIDGTLPSDNRIVPGCTVYVQDTNLCQEVCYSLIEGETGDPERGSINIRSPVGKALLGKREGDVALAETPSGKINFVITRVHFPKGCP